MALKKKVGGGGGVLLLYCIIGGLSGYLHPIFHIKFVVEQLYAFKFVVETVQNNNLVKYEICNTENSPLNTDFQLLKISWKNDIQYRVKK